MTNLRFNRKLVKLIIKYGYSVPINTTDFNPHVLLDIPMKIIIIE
jgi:hypothetical protein